MQAASESLGTLRTHPQGDLLLLASFCQPFVYRDGQWELSDAWALMDILAGVKHGALTDF